MFKLLITFIILGFSGLLIFSIYKIFLIKKETKTEPDIDVMILQLKSVILELERKSQLGIENAEATLKDYKEQLKKAELIKQKTKNL